MEFTVIFENLDAETEQYVRETASAMGMRCRKAYHRIEVDAHELEQIKDMLAVAIVAQENAQ